jgi:hypothetical protein
VGGEARNVTDLLRKLWCNDEGQDIAEYAVTLAAIFAILVVAMRLFGSHANAVSSSVSSIR